jgi:hypothetical protein
VNNIYTLLILLLLLQQAAQGQTTLRGTVTDATNGEVLIGATLYEPSTGRGYTTNSYGHFAIPGIKDSLTVVVSYMGYIAQTLCIIPTSAPITIQLAPGVSEIEEVVVRGTGSRINNHGHHTISSLDLRNTPVLMAEKDVLKTIQLLPGVQRNSEGTSNFSVRGGSHDQNLMLIDGIPVYNINHLWGFVSVFNTDAVNSVNFYKGGIPASYGGRLSSVVDVMLREGNLNHYTGSVSIGIISSKFTLEGPIQKERSSFLLAGRRTIYDLFVAPTAYSLYGIMPGYYFQDYTLKLNHKLNANNTLYLSSYFGNDRVYLMQKYTDDESGSKYKSRYDLGWGNITTAFRWNNTSFPSLFSNLTLAYTHFNYVTSLKGTSTPADPDQSSTVEYQGYYSGINDIIGRWHLAYYGIPNHQLSAGVDVTWHMFNPGITNHYYKVDGVKDNDYSLNKGRQSRGEELNAYLDNRFSYGRFSGGAGVRHTIFSVDHKVYHGFQPRASLELKLLEGTSVFAGYNRMFQYLHLVSNSNLGMPTDLWLPISKKIPPQQADQISAGLKQRLAKGMQVSVEVYTKQMKNITDYRDGVVLRNQSTDWASVIIVGEGNSRGVELMIEKNRGDLTGWVSYTLSKSERTFSQIRTGNPFPFQYDRRHVANVFVCYKVSANRMLSATWVASSGHWMTVNHDSYMVNGQEVYNLMDRNNYRLWPYHHLDISYTASKQKIKGTRNWVFGVYNVYANHNTFMIVRQNQSMNDDSPKKLYSVALFPLIPFVAWEYQFK